MSWRAVRARVYWYSSRMVTILSWSASPSIELSAFLVHRFQPPARHSATMRRPPIDAQSYDLIPSKSRASAGVASRLPARSARSAAALTSWSLPEASTPLAPVISISSRSGLQIA